MNSDDFNFQARLGYAEQIGEARGAISIAITFLAHCSVSDNPSVRQTLDVLREAEERLQELRRVPLRSPEEAEAAAAEAILRLEQEEKANEPRD